MKRSEISDDIDFAKIDWSKIDEGKAKFIYNEAIARLDSIHKSIDGITSKAQSMLSFSATILTAIVGYSIKQWEDMQCPLKAALICAIVLLIAILVLLLMVFKPKGLNSAQGGPSAYFKEDYYLNSMENIYKGNIQTLYKYIKEDKAIMKLRAYLFTTSVKLYTAYPLIAAVVWAVFSLCANPNR